MQKAEGADAGAQKHKIVRNAGIAIVAIGVLAGGLIWLEHSKDSGAELADEKRVDDEEGDDVHQRIPAEGQPVDDLRL